MKILFLSPPMGMWVYFGRMKSIYPGYAQLAAYLLEKSNVEVEVLDCPALDMGLEDMLYEIKKRRPEVVAMGAGTTWVHCVFEAARVIKKHLPQIKIVCGGMHFNALPKETLSEQPEIDIVVVGEGEITLLELLEELKKSKPDLHQINGLAFREDGKIILTPPRSLIPDLDTLPLPAYHLFPMEKYVHYSYWPNAVRVVTSRGCIGKCYFCVQWRQYDYRKKENVGVWRSLSGKRVADQAELVVKKYGVKVFDIQDDDFNAQTQRLEEFCDEVIKRKLDFSWFCMGKADDFAHQTYLFPKMRKAGCIMILVGIEVESDEKLRTMGKGITLRQIKETVEKLRENDIATCGTVMVGFYDDDEATIKRRAELLDFMDPDLSTVNILVPYPGSQLYEQVKNTNLIEVKDYRFWDMAHPIMPTKYLSRQDIARLANWVNREFYSKPERIHRALYGYSNPLVGACCRNYFEIVSKVEECFLKGIPFV